MSQRENQRGVADQALFSLPSLQLAAHELKSPLALIRQLAEAISSGECTAEEVVRLAERIGLSSERALRLSEDLTRTSRLEAGWFSLEPIDPLPVCQDVISELRPLYEAQGRQLRLANRQRSLPLVVAHRDLLRRILLNFVDNALHYAPGKQPVELSLHYRRQAGLIRLGVRDYGPGLVGQIKRHLHQPTATPQPLSYRPQSSGLGLFIARQFAEAMQAQVGAVAHRDGASFYVDVPRSTQLGLWS